MESYGKLCAQVYDLTNIDLNRARIPQTRMFSIAGQLC
jgi:hypothetical protein